MLLMFLNFLLQLWVRTTSEDSLHAAGNWTNYSNWFTGLPTGLIKPLNRIDSKEWIIREWESLSGSVSQNNKVWGAWWWVGLRFSWGNTEIKGWKQFFLFSVIKHCVARVGIVVLKRHLHLTLWKSSSNAFNYFFSREWLRSVFCLSLERLYLSASHYALVNLQVIMFIVAIWVLSFSCCLIHLAKISWYEALYAQEIWNKQMYIGHNKTANVTLLHSSNTQKIAFN